MSKYGVYSDPVFGQNTEIYLEKRGNTDQKNSVFGHFSGSGHELEKVEPVAN